LSGDYGPPNGFGENFNKVTARFYYPASVEATVLNRMTCKQRPVIITDSNTTSIESIESSITIEAIGHRKYAVGHRNRDQGIGNRD
jgi:hypothetical protein